MSIETHTEIQKKKVVDAMHEDLDDVTTALTKARGIVGALMVVAKGLDDGLVTACTGWGKHLDTIIDNVSEEVKAVNRRMTGNGGPTIRQSVDRPLAAEVRKEKDSAADSTS